MVISSCFLYNNDLLEIGFEMGVAGCNLERGRGKTTPARVESIDKRCSFRGVSTAIRCGSTRRFRCTNRQLHWSDIE